MSEVADFFAVPAAALISSVTAGTPNLVCYGAGRKVAGGDKFIQNLRSNLSSKRVDSLVASNFSAKLENRNGLRYTLLLGLGADAVPADNYDNENARAKALLPHIVRSMNVSDWSDKSVRVNTQIVDSLHEQLGPATVVLDDTSRITEINDKAVSLLRSCNGIKEAGGRLEISEPSIARRFKAYLRSQFTDPGAKPVFLNISGYDGAEKLTLLLKRRESPACQVVIHVRCLRSSSLTLPAHITQEYQLSPKEARLTAGLLQGRSLGHLASEFNVSTNTLRAQTKSIFKKTKVRSQAALILLVLDDHSSVFEY